MIDFFRSLPQGLFWYPLVAVLVILMIRTLVRVSRKPRRAGRLAQSRVIGGGRFAALIEFAHADEHARSELERHCIGLLLEISGYGAYSVDGCRVFAENTTNPLLATAIAHHLKEADPPADSLIEAPADARSLPPVCRVVVAELIRITEE